MHPGLLDTQTPSAFTAALQRAGLCGRVSLSVFQYDFPNTREPQALSGSVSSPILVTLVQQRNGAASFCPQLMSLSLCMSLMGCTSHSCACACARTRARARPALLPADAHVAVVEVDVTILYLFVV